MDDFGDILFTYQPNLKSLQNNIFFKKKTYLYYTFFKEFQFIKKIVLKVRQRKYSGWFQTSTVFRVNERW